MIGPAQADGIGPAELGKRLAARFLSANDDVVVDDFAGTGIPDRAQVHLHSERSSQLDLDVANVAWLVNSPRDGGNQGSRQNGQRKQENR